MRFQTSETIPLQDPEIVLRVLETCLRHISTDVVRSGPEITLHGLGPSPRTVNQRDITILRVQAEPDRTVIDVDVTFQASAFLGEASQDDIVRSKLDRVFDQMKLQLSLEQMEQKRTPPPSPSVLTQPQSIPPAEIPSPLETPIPISAPAPTTHSEPDIPQASPKTEPRSEPQLPLQQSPPSRIQQPNQESSQEFNQESSQALSHRFDASPTTRRTGLLIAAVAALLVIASALYFLHPHPTRSAPPVSSSTSSPPAAPPLAIKQDSSAAPATTPAPPPSIPPPSPSTPTGADSKIWLEGWAAAMRTRDPVAQASFYADSVDRYLDRHNVSNAQILQDKKNAIHNRDGLWTVKLEDIIVTQQTETTAVVHFTKHYIPQTEPAQISEQFEFHSRLQLTRLNGQWKITSEQDLP